MAAADPADRLRTLLRRRAPESMPFGQADLDALMAAVARRQRRALADWAEAYYRQQPDEPSDAALAALDADDPSLDPEPYALRSRIALGELVWVLEGLGKALEEAFADFVSGLAAERLPEARERRRRAGHRAEESLAALGLLTRMRADRQRFLERQAAGTRGPSAT